MRNRLAMMIVTLLTAFASVAACTSTAGYTKLTPQIALDPAAPCPRSLGRAQDVRNSGSGLNHRLLPIELPRLGLVCVYRSTLQPGSARTEPQLRRTVRLTAQAASLLTLDLTHVSLRSPHGKFNCPAVLPGDVTLLAFGYPHRSAVDLWYSTTGCSSLDNGHIVTSGAGNPSFYDHFTKGLDALLR